MPPNDNRTRSCVGFTGTRKGMTPEQADVVRQMLDDVGELHHGDCIGADADAVHLAMQAAHAIRLVAHPCTKTEARAWTPSHVVHPVRPPLVRNHDIVDDAQWLIACPGGPEKLRSGTWATIRYAIKKRLPVVIVRPDGSIQE